MKKQYVKINIMLQEMKMKLSEHTLFRKGTHEWHRLSHSRCICIHTQCV